MSIIFRSKFVLDRLAKSSKLLAIIAAGLLQVGRCSFS